VVEGQRGTFPLLEAAGMKIAVCRSADEVLAAMWKWNILARKAAP
jgi:hypothetical protein